MHKFKILIADDSEAVRRGLESLLSNISTGWIVCGEAAEGEVLRKLQIPSPT
jgi:YesN/AraC family two-component response regulator